MKNFLRFLAEWLAYWEKVAAGSRQPNPGDTRDEAAARIAELRRELEAREAA